MSIVEQGALTRRQSGAEPVPGYRLIEPLGHGGFGEVWKCEAPGGVFKAIKFVRFGAGGEGPAKQENEALQRVKTLRHAYILSLDRLEVLDDELLIIMELADQSLHELWMHCRQSGQLGIPRDELLAYLLEAAEALDWMNFEHGLQHLDVKPHNLFLVCNHLKVADFGLVSSLGDDRGEQAKVRQGGVTPLYSAPELLRGGLSRNSDQYSLAVVYQQLLTGTVPFWHTNVYELMMQHLSGAPDLNALPENDRPVVLRALSKVPQQRYPSCMEFVQALVGGQVSSGIRQSGSWRRVLVGSRPDAAPPSAPSRGLIPIPPAQMAPPPACPAPPTAPAPANPPGSWEATPPNQSQTPTKKLRSLGSSARPSDPGISSDPRGAAGPGAPAYGMSPSPTAVMLPGFRFLSCIQQGPLGDLWRAEDSAGRPRRALCVLNFVRYDARLISHLQALRDPALPNTEVHWSPAERLVILTDSFEKTLRERFDDCRTAGQPGIPRAELLPMLRSVAEALDALDARHGLQHMGINPRNLLIDGSKLWLADFGLIPLVWLPTGQTAATINSRYAAPELFDRRPSRTADQYSLALIYAEMLTGIHPRPQRAGSGLHRRPTGPPNRPNSPSRWARNDVDLLPAPDREVVQRALSIDPEKRFESCTAFVEALEKAGIEVKETDLYHTLPPVIPFASLMGEAPAPDTQLPSLAQLILDLTTADPQSVQGPQNARYFVQPDGSWEYRFPLQLFTGAVQIKMNGLRDHWQGRIVHQDGDAYLMHIDMDEPRTFWKRCMKQPRRLEVDLQVNPPVGPQTRLTEATVRVRCTGDGQEQKERILTDMVPKIFDTVRLYFQATQEQRGRERWPLTYPIRVYPVLPDLELADVIEGVCQNVSLGGIRFRLPKRPPSEQLYLHLYSSPVTLGYALLAKTARVLETPEGCEVGALFTTGGE